jgi:hypothetical protein
MSRDRFREILSNLHINDNQSLNKTDKLYKIRPLIEKLNNNFVSFRSPPQNLSIDESCVKFKGRSSLKMFNASKPNKRHFKLWALADMSGYVFSFDVYQGKENYDLANDEVIKSSFDLLFTNNNFYTG